MVLTPIYFLVVGLVGRSPLFVQDLMQRDPFEKARWAWVLPATTVVSFFFVIEELLRKRLPPAPGLRVFPFATRGQLGHGQTGTFALRPAQQKKIV